MVNGSRSARRHLGGVFVRCLAGCLVLWSLAGCSFFGVDLSAKPTAAELGHGARAGGLFDKKQATECVGSLIGDASLRRDTLGHIVRGDLDGRDPNWSMGEDEAGHFQYNVEWKMYKKCGVQPWVSALSLGDCALRGGLTTDPKAVKCVGALIRDSGLDPDFLGALPSSSFHPKDEKWWVTTEADRKAFHSVVEIKMESTCGVKPWPGRRPWNGQAD